MLQVHEDEILPIEDKIRLSYAVNTMASEDLATQAIVLIFPHYSGLGTGNVKWTIVSSLVFKFGQLKP